MRGRKPKPPKLKIMDGNPGKRRGKTAPLMEAGEPTCPRWLGPTARAEWRRVARELAAAGILARADLAVLAAYCTTWERFQKATRAVARDGLTYEVATEHGVTIRRRPEVGIAEAAEKQLRLLASELGLTQLSRQRMDVAPAEDADPFEALLNGRSRAN